jgi:hypothetical protein
VHHPSYQERGYPILLITAVVAVVVSMNPVREGRITDDESHLSPNAYPLREVRTGGRKRAVRTRERTVKTAAHQSP